MKFIRISCSILLVILIIIALSVLGFIVTLNMTVLDPDFMVAEMEKYDVYTEVFDEVKGHIPEVIPEEVIDDLFIRYKPWLTEQVQKIVYASYSYIKEGKEFNVVISLESISGSIEQTIMDYIYEYLPPALQDAPESLIKPYVSQIYAEIEPYIPGEIELNEETVGSDVISAFEEVRQVLHYIRLAYIIALCVIVVSLLIIALLHWFRFRPFALYTGIAFACAGLVSIIGTFIIRSVTAGIDFFAEADLVSEGFQEIVVQMIADSIQPMLYYGIGFAVAGMALLFCSLFIRQLE